MKAIVEANPGVSITITVVCNSMQVIQYYRTALSCATLTAGWEKDTTKCVDIMRLAHRLSGGKFQWFCGTESCNNWCCRMSLPMSKMNLYSASFWSISTALLCATLARDQWLSNTAAVKYWITDTNRQKVPNSWAGNEEGRTDDQNLAKTLRCFLLLLLSGND